MTSPLAKLDALRKFTRDPRDSIERLAAIAVRVDSLVERHRRDEMAHLKEAQARAEALIHRLTESVVSLQPLEPAMAELSRLRLVLAAEKSGLAEASLATQQHREDLLRREEEARRMIQTLRQSAALQKKKPASEVVQTIEQVLVRCNLLQPSAAAPCSGSHRHETRGKP